MRIIIVHPIHGILILISISQGRKICKYIIRKILSSLAGANVTGRISDERFARMSATYEAEQQTLEKRVATGSSAFRLSTTPLAQ